MSRRAALILLAAASALRAEPNAPDPYDLVLRNGRVVDGTGNPWYRADVAIRGDTIVRIAPSIRGPARIAWKRVVRRPAAPRGWARAVRTTRRCTGRPPAVIDRASIRIGTRCSVGISAMSTT